MEKLLNMSHKIIFICFLAVFLQLKMYAQEVSKGNIKELNLQTLLKTIPSFEVRDIQGNVFKLNEYISNNKLHNEKPFLIVIWGTNGSEGLGVDRLNALDFAKLGDEFNIVALCKSHEKDKNKQAKDMQELMTKFNIKNKWGKFLIAVTDWEGLNNFYMTVFPRLIYADKKMNIISDGYLTKNGFEKEILKAIDKGMIKRGESWYTREYDLIPGTDPRAFYYEKYSTIPNGINFKRGSKAGVLTNVSYVKKGEEYLIHGLYEANYESGKIQYSGEFKEGTHSTTYKAWFEDGKIAGIIPVNGTLKFYDANGQVSYEGPMKNGLGDGLFTQYNEAKKVSQRNFVSGVLIGLVTEYKADGSILNESYASPVFEGYDTFKPKIKEGLQWVVINGKHGFIDRQGIVKIPAIYEYAGNFINGSAHVKLHGEDFYINKKGERTNEKYE